MRIGRDDGRQLSYVDAKDFREAREVLNLGKRVPGRPAIDATAGNAELPGDFGSVVLAQQARKCSVHSTYVPWTAR